MKPVDEQHEEEIVVERFDGKARVHAEGASKRMIENQAKGLVRNGSVVVSQLSGARYRLENVRPGAIATVRRAEPKVKGKAARKAEKRRRRERGWLP